MTTMIRNVAIFLAFLVCFVRAVFAFSPQLVKILQGSGYQPTSVVILLDASDDMRVCADNNNGLLACRRVDEFRIWARSGYRK